jgi:hypothetical protein
VEQAEERRQQASRELRTWVDEDGMVVVRGRLTPEVGAVLRRALEAACDQARRSPASDGGAEEKAADGSAGVEEEAAAAPAGGDRKAAAESADAAEPTLAQRQADAIGTVAEAALAGGLDRGTAGDRYQVVLHVDSEALAEPRDVPAGTSGGAASGSAPGADGGRVPAGTSGCAASGSEARAGGDRVPAGTPAAAHGPGDGSPMHTPRRAGRARRSRRRRTSGPCPGAWPTTPASDTGGMRTRHRGIRTLRRSRSEIRSRAVRAPAGERAI